MKNKVFSEMFSKFSAMRSDRDSEVGKLTAELEQTTAKITELEAAMVDATEKNNEAAFIKANQALPAVKSRAKFLESRLDHLKENPPLTVEQFNAERQAIMDEKDVLIAAEIGELLPLLDQIAAVHDKYTSLHNDGSEAAQALVSAGGSENDGYRIYWTDFHNHSLDHPVSALLDTRKDFNDESRYPQVKSALHHAAENNAGKVNADNTDDQDTAVQHKAEKRKNGTAITREEAAGLM